MGALSGSDLLIGGGVGLQAGSGILQARGERAAAKSESQAARFNAELALKEGRLETARRRKAARHSLSSQRVSIAKSGVRAEGSPLDALIANAAELERDALNASLDAQGTANLERMKAKTAEATGKRRATAALLGGATRAATFGIPLYIG